MLSLSEPCLALLTDRTRLTPNWTLAQAIAPAITGGCNLVILRESDIPANHRLTIARFVRDAVHGRVPYLIADDGDLAKKIGAQGVLLTRLDRAVAIRKSIGEQQLFGVSVRNRQEAEEAVTMAVDYLLIEYDWTDPGRVIEHFRTLREGMSVPIIVGTDMPVEMVGACRAAGAAGVAICGPAMCAYDRTAACRAYANVLNIGF